MVGHQDRNPGGYFAALWQLSACDGPEVNVEDAAAVAFPATSGHPPIMFYSHRLVLSGHTGSLPVRPICPGLSTLSLATVPEDAPIADGLGLCNIAVCRQRACDPPRDKDVPHSA